jgi:hypothetical protein
LNALVVGEEFVLAPISFLFFANHRSENNRGRFAENLTIPMPQMAAEQTRFLYNQSSWRNAALRIAPDSL